MSDDRLEVRARMTDEIKPERVYVESWSTCLHAFRRMGEIGPARLEECEDCRLVVGVAR